MAELRLLVTGRTQDHILARLHEAITIADDHAHDGDVEIVVIRSSSLRGASALDRVVLQDPRTRMVTNDGHDHVDHLDVGLFLRPLPTTVAVVGDTTAWLRDMILIAGMIERAGVGAAITRDARHHVARTLLGHGGVFAAGPLCTAGGFSGHGAPGSIQDRLEWLGFTTLELSETPSPAPERSSQPFADARSA